MTVSWKAATDNVGVKAYRIYKNGELLTEISDKLNYRDEEVEPDQSYQYEVAAVDEAGNEAEKSNKLSCLVTLPVILNITPENGARIGKQKSEIDVTLLNYAEAGKKTITCSYYKPDTDSWELIGTTSVSPFIANTTSRIYWDTSAFLEDADIRVRVVVLDEDRNAAQQELTLHLDRTPPALPELTGSEKDAKITLTWNRSADEDCAVYQVYRKAVSGNDMEEAYRKICSVKTMERTAINLRIPLNFNRVHMFTIYRCRIYLEACSDRAHRNICCNRSDTTDAPDGCVGAYKNRFFGYAWIQWSKG